MIPPESIDVLDQHGGFTAVTKLGGLPGPSVFAARRMSLDEFQQAINTHRFDTLWRPGKVLNGITQGGLVKPYHTNSFYQLNNNVTLAFYRVLGYNYLVAVWFDNLTGRRIA
jgi:hypothetical protein